TVRGPCPAECLFANVNSFRIFLLFTISLRRTTQFFKSLVRSMTVLSQVVVCKHYVFYWGILGWGMFVFLSTTFSYWYEKYGWHFPSRGDLYFATLVELPLWSLETQTF